MDCSFNLCLKCKCNSLMSILHPYPVLLITFYQSVRPVSNISAIGTIEVLNSVHTHFHFIFILSIKYWFYLITWNFSTKNLCEIKFLRLLAISIYHNLKISMFTINFVLKQWNFYFSNNTNFYNSIDLIIIIIINDF
jgi:hypothetical protein